jgi:dipeptidyl-peptidase 4
VIASSNLSLERTEYKLLEQGVPSSKPRLTALLLLLIGLLISMFSIGCVVHFHFSNSPGPYFLTSDTRLLNYTVDSFLSGALVPRVPRLKWLESPDVAYTTIRDSGELVCVSNSGVEQVLCADTSLTRRARDYWVSPGAHFVLFALECEAISWKTLCRYVIFNVATATERDLTDAALGKLQVAMFSPAGDANSAQVAFVRGNDLWIARVDGSGDVRITSDGQLNQIVSGVGDWLYDYRLLGRSSHLGRPTLWWSPDGARLAFTRINESRVPFFSFPLYVEFPMFYLNQTI